MHMHGNCAVEVLHVQKKQNRKLQLQEAHRPVYCSEPRAQVRSIS